MWCELNIRKLEQTKYLKKKPLIETRKKNEF